MIPRMLLASALVLLAAAAGAAPPHADGDFVLLDTNHDGTLSRDEAALQPVVSAEFDRLDANKDGKLSRAEFAAFEVMADRELRDRQPPDQEAAAAAKVLTK